MQTSRRRAFDSGPLDILIHTSGLTISGEDPVALSLGGSETAVVSMARALAGLGHRVTVACNTERPGAVGGVSYLPEGDMGKSLAGREHDLFVAARFYSVMRSPPPARMYGLWHHDMPSEESLGELRLAMARASFSLFLSRFQLDAYARYLPDLDRHAVLTSNGIDFDALGEVRDEVTSSGGSLRFVFASRPERGLVDLLRDIWPRLKARLPSAELLVTSYAFLGRRLPSQVQGFHRHCDALIERSPGVRRIGPLTRRAFWREMAASTAVLYPTDFPEINCMVALEAQALGVPIVTSDRFALRETVGCRDTRIAEPWGSPAYAERFEAAVVRLVEDEGFYRAAQARGRQHVSRDSHSWEALARRWQELIEQRFEERFARSQAGVLRRLLRWSEVAAAHRLVTAPAAPEEAFNPPDLAELSARLASRRADNTEGPQWHEFAPDALPPQLEMTYRGIFRLLGGPPAKEERVSVLDIGCFVGNLGLLLLRDHPGFELTGIEDNRSAVDFAVRKARELGLEARARFLHLAAPYHAAGDLPEVATRRHDVALLCEILERHDDPVALVEWAEGRARSGVAGYTLLGPWEVETGERRQRHHLGYRELRDLFGGKRDLELRYVRIGHTLRGEELGCWFFSYRVAESNRRGVLDLDRKIRRAPPLPKISATILVHNEEAHIRRCLESLEPIVDEVLIGDTGATDHTLPILEGMGFRRVAPVPDDATIPPSAGPKIVLPVPFEDFAQARNDLASYATGDYLLWQDADEIMIRAPVLRSLVDDNEYFDGFSIEQRHVVLDGNLDSDHPLRCFRPRTADGPLRWFGCVHEHVELRLNEPPRRILHCPEVYVAHFGYLHRELGQNKALHRNWRLLIEDRRQNPERLLGYLLGIREYHLAARWELQYAGRMTEKAYQCLNYGYEIWHRYGERLRGGYWSLGFRLSRDILRTLAEHRLPLRLTGRVPFPVTLELEVLPAPVPPPQERRPAFYASLDEVRAFLARRVAEEGERLAGRGRPPEPDFPQREAAELRGWSLPPELFGLEPFE